MICHREGIVLDFPKKSVPSGIIRAENLPPFSTATHPVVREIYGQNKGGKPFVLNAKQPLKLQKK